MELLAKSPGILVWIALKVIVLFAMSILFNGLGICNNKVVLNYPGKAIYKRYFNQRKVNASATDG